MSDNDKHWLNELVEDYTRNSGNYPHFYDGIQGAIESYLQYQPEEQQKIKIYVPFGEKGGRIFM